MAGAKRAMLATLARRKLSLKRSPAHLRYAVATTSQRIEAPSSPTQSGEIRIVYILRRPGSERLCSGPSCARLLAPHTDQSHGPALRRLARTGSSRRVAER